MRKVSPVDAVDDRAFVPNDCEVRTVTYRACSLYAAMVLALMLGSAFSLSAQSKPVPATALKEDVNHRDPDGSTPLQWAVYDGKVTEIQRLLKAGANVSLANNYGASPMSLPRKSEMRRS